MNNNFTTIDIGEKTKNKNILFKILKIFGWIFIIGMIFIYNSYSNFKNQIITNEEIIININNDYTLYTIGDKLNLNQYFFKYYVKNNFPDFKLNTGKYKIEKYAKLEDLFVYLQKPIFNEINITILEGWNIYDIDQCLSNPEKTIIKKQGKEISGCLSKIDKGEKIFIKTPLIKKGEYIQYVTNKDKIEQLSNLDFPFIKGLNTLEGFLYPDTYKIIQDNFKINNFVISQLNNFENKVYKKLFLTKTNLKQKYDNETISDVINLASIVEKEEKNINSKPTVAGILKKRLNSGWKIGADITVCYPHKLTANECKMVISKYINEESEYNTRTMVGLPKTPIGNPSYETINATLNDKKTEYWFYLHDTQTGKIYYGITNEDHTKNKRLYLR